MSHTPVAQVLALSGGVGGAKLVAGLAQVVDFYDQRFAMNLSASEKADLVAFLRTL